MEPITFFMILPREMVMGRDKDATHIDLISGKVGRYERFFPTFDEALLTLQENVAVNQNEIRIEDYAIAQLCFEDKSAILSSIWAAFTGNVATKHRVRLLEVLITAK